MGQGNQTSQKSNLTQQAAGTVLTCTARPLLNINLHKTPGLILKLTHTMLLLPSKDLCSGQAHSAFCPHSQDQPQTLPHLFVFWTTTCNSVLQAGLKKTELIANSCFVNLGWIQQALNQRRRSTASLLALLYIFKIHYCYCIPQKFCSSLFCGKK